MRPHGHGRHQRQFLVNDRDTERTGFQRRLGANALSVDLNRPFKVGMNAAENFDERAFARAILARQDQHFAAINLQRHIAEHLNGAKALANTAHAGDHRGQSSLLILLKNF